MEKYTKKASTKLYKEVAKIDKKASKLISVDQAFVILMDNWGLELDVYSDVKGHTVCRLCKKDLDYYIYTWELENAFSKKDGDWDWDKVYNTVLGDILKLKLFRKTNYKKYSKKS